MIQFRLLLLDIYGWFLTVLLWIESQLAILLTVYTDPCNISKEPIRSQSGAFFVSDAETEYVRRIISWFYRHNDTPDLDDWVNLTKRFSLQYIPPHKIQALSGEYICIAITDQLYISAYSDNNCVSFKETIKLGGLNPFLIIKSVREKLSCR